MSKTLTLKQKAFVRFYLETDNATQAYKLAYDCAKMSDKAITVEASRLMANPNVALAIQAFDRKADVHTLLTLDEHMSELKTLRDLAKETGQMSAAIKAEELRGKLRRFYVEQIEHGSAGEFDNMSTDELRQFVLEEAAALSEDPNVLHKASGTKH